MNLKTFGTILALICTASSIQTPFDYQDTNEYQDTYDILSHTIADNGWERSSTIVSGPTYITSDHIYRNTTWSVDLLPHHKDLVRKSAPFKWVESGSSESVTYGFHVREGITGYVAQKTTWHILTGYVRTKRNGIIVREELVTTVSPKVLFNGGLDGVVTFIRIH